MSHQRSKRRIRDLSQRKTLNLKIVKVEGTNVDNTCDESSSEDEDPLGGENSDHFGSVSKAQVESETPSGNTVPDSSSLFIPKSQKLRPKESQLKLVEMLRDYPCLWDKSSSKYRDSLLCASALRTIGFALGIEDNRKVKDMIVYVRKRITNGPSWTKSGSAAPHRMSRSQWDKLSRIGGFLKDNKTKHESSSPMSSAKINLQNKMTHTPLVQPSQANVLFFESITQRIEEFPEDDQLELQMQILKLISDRKKLIRERINQ